MKEIVFNEESILEEKVDEIVTRVKALIIDSENNILLGYSYKTFQFPGGHIEPGESLKKCLEREILEETGMSLTIANDPFVKISNYTSNYRGTGLNRRNDIYYFIVKTDEKYDMRYAHLDSVEKEGNYVLRKIPLSSVQSVLTNSIKDNPINEIIVKEMIEILQEYENLK